MMLLDTHAWLWWATQDWARFPPRLRGALLQPVSGLAISAASVYELSVLARRNRINLTLPLEAWLDAATSEAHVAVLAVDERIARCAGRLPCLHGDPIDRLLVATAQIHGLTLISKDEFIHQYPDTLVRWSD